MQMPFGLNVGMPHVKVSAEENGFGRGTFVSDAIGNAIEPMNGHLNTEIANLK